MVNGIYAAITCGAVAGVIGGRDQCLQFGAYSRLSLSWSVLNAAGDVLLAVLAVNALWSARMKRSTKLVASLILTLGTVGGIASIVRLYVIAHDNGLGNMQAGINIAKWTVVEMAAGICAASLACLRPLLSQLKSSILRIRSRLTGTDTHHPTAMESRPAPSRAMTADSQRQILEWETSYNALALKEPLPTYTRTDRKESHRAKSVALPPPPKIGILPEAD
ncbi:hypothetical protein ANO11243_072770 [Dothideomycetidae sp. 11243]|nr:hypothetical protein ANO11243_072770 [fungal sp. No.11243]